MIVGTTIFKMDGNTFYTPEFPRGGLAATFAVEARNISSGASVTIGIEHRNDDDTSWTSAGSFSAITATGTSTVDITGIKEMIRLTFTFDAGDAATDGIHFFLPAPAWRPYP